MKSDHYKNCLYILGGVILTVPLLVTRWTLYPYIHGKTIAVLIAAHLALLIFLIGRYQGIFRPVKLSPLAGAALVFVLASLVTSWFGVNMEKSIWGSFPRLLGLYHLVLIFGLALVFGTVFTKEDWRRLLTYGLGVSAIISGIAILQKFFPWFVWYGSRVGSTLDNPAFLAGYLIFFIFWGLILEAGEPIISKRRWYLALTTINMVALVLTKTRGALLGLVIGLLVVTGLLIFKKEGRKIGLMLLGVLGAMVPIAIFLDRYRILVNHLTDTTTLSRLIIWKSAWLGFLKRPIGGWGFENFNAPFNIFYNPKLLAFSYSETFADKAHNNFIELLATTGVVGLLAYLGLFVITGYSILKLYQSSKLTFFERAFFIGLFIAYAISLCFLFDQLFTLVLFAFTLAYLHTLSASERSTKSMRPYVLGLASIALVISAWIGVVKPAMTSVYTHRAVSIFQNDYRRGLDYFSQALAWSGPWYPDVLSEKAGAINENLFALKTTGRVPRQEIISTFEALEKAMDKYPYDIRFPIFIGYLGNQLGINEDIYLARTNAVLTKALDHLNPDRQQISYLLIENDLLQNKTAEAIMEARRIVSEASTVADSHYYLGNALLLAGNEIDGLQEIKEAERLGYPEIGAKPFILLITKSVEAKDWLRVAVLYNRAVIVEPTNASLFAQLAAVYKKMGEFEKARQAVEKAVQLNPSLKKEAEIFLKSLK